MLKNIWSPQVYQAEIKDDYWWFDETTIIPFIGLIPLSVIELYCDDLTMQVTYSIFDFVMDGCLFACRENFKCLG